VFGYNPLFAGFAFSFLNCLALFACYVLVKKNVNTFSASLSVLLLATSPLAVAHSRMPYHITPIITFFLIYLWSLQLLAAKKKWGVLLASLSWALLFQFELALFPMILLIFFTLWKKSIRQKSTFWQLPLGLVIGLFPQVIYDIRHHFAQLGGFVVWTTRQIVAFFVPGRSHTFSFSQLNVTWTHFSTFFSRIFSIDHPWIGTIVFLILILCMVLIYLRAKKNLFLQQATLALTLLFAAFIVHGSPSEAYFPPIILLSCIVIGCGVSLLSHKSKFILTGALVILALYNTADIVANHFFTFPTSTDFQYGLSYHDLVSVMKYIDDQSGGANYVLRSTDPDAHFESYLNNYQAVGIYLAQNYPHNQEKLPPPKIFALNKPNSELLSYPQAKITSFQFVDVIELPKDIK
jgi:hypothetical protein